LFSLLFFRAFSIDKNSIDSLKQSIQKTEIDTIRFDLNYKIAVLYITTYPDSCIYFLNQGIQKINAQDHPFRYYNAMNLKGSAFWFKNDLDSSVYYYKKALNTILKNKHPNKVAMINNNLGIIFNYKGLPDSALHYITIAYNIYDSLGNKKAFAKAALDLGNVYTAISSYDQAIDKLLAGMATFEEIKDSVYLIHGYNALGNFYLSINDAKEAIKYYKKSLALSHEFPKTDISSELYCNIGLCYYQGLKEFDSAEYYFNKVLAKPGIEQNNILYPTVLVNLGALYNNKGEFVKALDLFQKVIEMPENQSGPYSRMAASVNLGNTYMELNDINKGLKYLNEGLQQAIELDNIEFQKDAYLYLAKADSIRGDYKGALSYYQKYIKLAKKVHNKELEEKISAIQAKYELQKTKSENDWLKEQNALKLGLISKHKKLNLVTSLALILTVIVLLFTIFMYHRTQKLNQRLKAKNEQINQQREELLVLNNQLNKLISIIAHDLRAPFNALIGLLNELDANSEHYSEEEKNAIIKGLLQNTRTTYNMLENLMEWSVSKTGVLKLHWEKLKLYDLMEEVIQLNKLQLDSKQLVINNQLSPSCIIAGDRKMVFTILTNLINNAIKYSYSKGVITIRSEKIKDRVRIHISDEGIGIPHEHLEDIFSIDSEYQIRGTENEYGTGLGLKVVSEFIKRMNGKIYVVSEKGLGSTFTFELPAEPPQ
jgi:signal transduction histidine kinase